MTIDIISYTDAQYAALTEEQLLEVKSAQQKKNRLDLQLQEDLEREKYALVDKGIFLSNIYELYRAKRQAEHDAEVEAVREALLFYLRFATKPQSSQTQDSPYAVDYSLSMEERYFAVRDHYMETYEDGAERFAAFKADEVAVQYLGEWYSTLYDYLYTYV